MSIEYENQQNQKKDVGNRNAFLSKFNPSNQNRLIPNSVLKFLNYVNLDRFQQIKLKLFTRYE